MKTAYFDCFSGIAGNMILGALLDAGLDRKLWEKEIRKVPLPGYSMKIAKTLQGEFSATLFDLAAKGREPSLSGKEILSIIDKSRVGKHVKEQSVRIFSRLIRAEEKVHGKKHPFFHEIGVIDTVVDIVGSVIALELMDIEEVYSSPINLGSGTVKTHHGTFPVPAPATAELIKGFPVYQSDVGFELTTPTGAAIITTLASGFSPMPEMEVQSIGYGAGTYAAAHYDLLRVFVGEKKTSPEEDIVQVIETNLDDMNPEIFSSLFDRLFSAGALDVWITPVQMKKNRPGQLLSVLSTPGKSPALISMILNETSSFGVRCHEVKRKKLKREFKEVLTPFGKIKVKVGLMGKSVIKQSPEYESCLEAAKKKNVPLKKVYEAVLRAIA
jgi:pyridinium-3,5-bisthiocarboxylic acid mononucleotide nickel chelatase